MQYSSIFIFTITTKGKEQYCINCLVVKLLMIMLMVLPT